MLKKGINSSTTLSHRLTVKLSNINCSHVIKLWFINCLIDGVTLSKAELKIIVHTEDNQNHKKLSDLILLNSMLQLNSDWPECAD